MYHAVQPQETTPSSPCPSSSSARYLRRDFITNERVAGIKVQRTTAASGNPKAGDEMQRTTLAGVDKKVRGLWARAGKGTTHVCTHESTKSQRSKIGFGRRIHGRLSSRVSAHGCRLNLASATKEEDEEEETTGRTLIFIRRSLTTMRVECRLLSIVGSTILKTIRGQLSRTF